VSNAVVRRMILTAVRCSSAFQSSNLHMITHAPNSSRHLAYRPLNPHHRSRVREALVIQIQGLKQEVEPQSEKLHLMAQKLQETERECEMAHKALSDKDSLLSLKSASVLMLQKQVRDLRNRSASKDSSLQRAAALLEQYQQIMLAVDISAAAAQSINMRNSRAKASLTNKPSLLGLSSTGPVDLLGASKGTQRLLGASLKTVPSAALSAEGYTEENQSFHLTAAAERSVTATPYGNGFG
jgi:hypothetical protein